jgi:hypothetical protein
MKRVLAGRLNAKPRIGKDDTVLGLKYSVGKLSFQHTGTSISE